MLRGHFQANVERPNPLAGDFFFGFGRRSQNVAEFSSAKLRVDVVALFKQDSRLLSEPLRFSLLLERFDFRYR